MINYISLAVSIFVGLVIVKCKIVTKFSCCQSFWLDLVIFRFGSVKLSSEPAEKKLVG